MSTSPPAACDSHLSFGTRPDTSSSCFDPDHTPRAAPAAPHNRAGGCPALWKAEAQPSGAQETPSSNSCSPSFLSKKQQAGGKQPMNYLLSHKSYKINSFDREGEKVSNKQKKNSMCSFSVGQFAQVHSHTKSICSSVESLRKGRAHHSITSSQLSRLSQW